MTARRTFAAVLAGLVVAALPATALAARPQAMSPAAYNALVATGQAMNARYGNALTGLSATQFAELWREGGSKLTPEALNALLVRSRAMNAAAAAQFHGLPPAAAAALEAEGKALNARYANVLTRPSPKQVTTPGTSFAWDDFGIGVAAAVGIALLAGGIAVAARTARRQRVEARIG